MTNSADSNVVPSGNPWQKKDATSYHHRYEMTKLLIGNSNDLEISDIENSEENLHIHMKL